MSEIIYKNPETNLVVVAPSKNSSKKEQKKRLAEYLATLVEQEYWAEKKKAD